METTSLAECSICQLPFHASVSSRQNQCPFCERCFTRADAARRHAEKCHARGEKELPPKTKRGRKLRACDECSRIKTSCDSKYPCRRCAARSLSCTYSWVCCDPSHQTAAPEIKDRSDPRGQTSTFSFFLNLADPNAKSLNEIAVKEPERDGEEAVAWKRTRPSDGQANSMSTNFMDPFFSEFLEFDDLNDALMANDSSLVFGDVGNDSLDWRVRLLIDDLKGFTAAKPHLQDLSSQDPFHQFFTGANAYDCIMNFYRRGYFQSPIIHWPTLDPEKISLPLLLAMMLLGNTYSRHQEQKVTDIHFITSLHCVAEDYIFKKLKACTHSTTDISTDDTTILEACQAALIIIGLQMGLNDSAIRQRIMGKRHPFFVVTLRRLGWLQKRHNSSTLNGDWQAFIREESCIRLANSTFLTDTLWPMFFNNPPAMTLLEMSGDMPCGQEVWEAESEDAFEAAWSNSRLSPGSFCLNTLVGGLLQDDFDETTMAQYSRLTHHHLHALIATFNSITFNHHAMMLPRSSFDPILRALDRWKKLWDVAVHRVPTEQQKWMGVTRHAPEMALMCRGVILLHGTEMGRSLAYTQRITQYDATSFYEFVQFLKKLETLQQNTAG